MRVRTLLLLPALLGGCDALGPWREGQWRPGGANTANLLVMVAEPRELVRGTGAVGADGQQAAEAVARLRADRVRPLPDNAVVRIGTSGGGAP
ncbi:hypothetical protein ACI6QG_17710 [Roseococcus sp. DSY-14]|uniref:hypothetical protein n=1 Tax=Roseococcus sp. DSY-14 TaxID=3369650 RepID=UPI00387AC198